jgi:RecB family endonuclease NucS
MISWHEADIEDYVCENYKDMFGTQYHFLGRQINLGLGILDVLLYNDEEKTLYVLEIKNQAICNNALVQVIKYIQGIYDYLLPKKDLDIEVIQVRGMLLGPDPKDDVKTALRRLSKWIDFYELNVKIDVSAEYTTFHRVKDHESYKPEKFIELIADQINQINKECEEEEHEEVT